MTEPRAPAVVIAESLGVTKDGKCMWSVNRAIPARWVHPRKLHVAEVDDRVSASSTNEKAETSQKEFR